MERKLGRQINTGIQQEVNQTNDPYVQTPGNALMDRARAIQEASVIDMMGQLQGLSSEGLTQRLTELRRNKEVTIVLDRSSNSA